MTTNRFFTLESRPDGELADSDLRRHEQPIAAPAEGQIQVRTTCLSIDPTVRIWMSDIPQYMPPIELGAVVRSLGVGVVEQSANPGFAVGDRVIGMLGWATHPTFDPAVAMVQPLPAGLPLSDAKVLSLLGLTAGPTAYFGLLDVAQPREGETLVVDAAAGSVGGLVGQIGKIKGCRVVGIAGGPDKCAYVTETLGFDACIDYKNADVGKGLDEHCPNGIDVCFENVGGPIFDEILLRMNLNGRVSLCGLIADYNEAGRPVPGPYNFGMILMRRLRVQGFIVIDFLDRYDQATADLLTWARQGRLMTTEDVRKGFDALPQTLRELLRGEKSHGKLVLEP
ncbi:NADP-dependent oxidoreductase [Paraliomyxa miuraensis]|uniref:NADP-dependent oxidoreductase n=1 Tax=Paraliomyxa miuraensis TaxID=376150 RepID=UPI00224E598B|nr:NADP-dependent oxidoreductase [Paraliomyxa miuraensis]MCX4244149.1 NADP-dependent oxidoreductase [Paraliomyxa miuraensis]